LSCWPPRSSPTRPRPNCLSQNDLSSTCYSTTTGAAPNGTAISVSNAPNITSSTPEASAAKFPTNANVSTWPKASAKNATKDGLSLTAHARSFLQLILRIRDARPSVQTKNAPNVRSDSFSMPSESVCLFRIYAILGTKLLEIALNVMADMSSTLMENVLEMSMLSDQRLILCANSGIRTCVWLARSELISTTREFVCRSMISVTPGMASKENALVAS